MRCSIKFFFHPDFTVGTGIHQEDVTGSAAYNYDKRVADYTAGWELHPTPKIYSFINFSIALYLKNFKIS